MTDVITGFNIATDVKVEFYLPDASGNLFILGVSLLGGDDELAGANQFIIGISELGGTDLLWGGDDIAFTWQNFECSVSRVETELGGEVFNSLYFQPRPARADITLQDLVIDPTTNPSFRAGVPVRVRIVKDALDYTLFQGIIDNIGVTYNQDGLNLLQVTAYDNVKKLFNTRIPLLDTLDPVEFPDEVATPYEVMEIIADQFGAAMDARSEDAFGLMPGTTLENFIPSGVIYDALKSGVAIWWIDQATGDFVFVPRPTSPDATGAYNIGNQHDLPLHLCMSAISVSGDLDNVYNSLYVELANDPTTNVLVKSQDSIELYGEIAVDETVNTTDLEQLKLWANAVYSQTTTKLVNSVTTPAISRLGNLTHAAIIEPAEVIKVIYQTPELNINDTYAVTKVSHSIDVDNWFTTLELWKGF